MFRKPDLARSMRQIVNLDAVKPELWAKTHEAVGLTADEVRAAVEAEKAHREDEKVLRQRPEVKADD